MEASIKIFAILIAGRAEAIIKEYNGMCWHYYYYHYFFLNSVLVLKPRLPIDIHMLHTNTHTPVVIKNLCHQEHILGSTCQSYYLPPSPRPTLWHTSEQLGQIIGNLPWPCPIIKTTNY